MNPTLFSEAKTYCKKRLSIFTILFSALIFAQNNEINNWCFGSYADLNFETLESPQSIQNSAMLAPKGSANISDKDGNLLFYTDSETVWDKNNNIMPNGSNLLGNRLADQNSIIIPVTDIENQYYLFTVGVDGFYYSIIDMSLNNGLGDVATANINLLSSPDVGKITAVHHADGKSFWVMTTKKIENDNYTAFYAYKINTDGTIEAPVITDQLYFPGSKEGIMKFSPDGTKLALSNFKENGLSNHLFKFDFDNSTGLLTNKFVIFTTRTLFAVVSAYGIEFSNDSNKLYVTQRYQGSLDVESGGVIDATPKIDQLYQYNLSNNTPSDEVTVLSSEPGTTVPGSLQLAKNGKIYRALSTEEGGTGYLGVINQPNNLGDSAAYSDAGISLNPNTSTVGLPNFVQSYFRTRILNDSICEGQPVDFMVDTYADITNAEWDFGDGNTSNEIMPNYTYSTVGPHNVSVTITVNNREITTSKRIDILARPNLINNQELIQCDDDTDGISLFNLENIREKITDPSLDEELVFFETIEDAELDTNPIPNPTTFINSEANQEIFVKVYNANNCFRITSFHVRAIYVDIVSVPDFHVCEDSDNTIGNNEGAFSMLQVENAIRDATEISSQTSLTFYHTLLDAQTIQNPIRTLNSPSTTIWVRAEEDNLACSGLFSMNLVVNALPQIALEDDYIFCGNTPLILNGHPSNDRFEWLNSEGQIISTLQQFSTTESGTYTHIAYKTVNGLECSNTQTFEVHNSEAPSFEDIDIDLDYNNNTISVVISGNSVYEFSTDNINFYGQSNSYVFYNIPSGMQTIYVRDINQCEETISQTFHLIGYPKFFTPNNDGVNDYWSIKGVEEDQIKSLQIFDRYGKRLITLNETNGYRWNGLINNKKLATNDYWFKVEYTDGNSKTGHFTLKN